MSALEVLFVDNHVLAVRKPACLPCVPDSSGDESLLDRARTWVEAEFRKPGRAFLGVVHRLDRPVSGVVVFGRTSKGAARLTAAFAERRAVKEYWGVAGGLPATASGALVQHLVKDRERNTVSVVAAGSSGAREARTSWRRLEARGQDALLELTPQTGRPHQLRVAARALAAPLLGDLRYGAQRPLPDRSIALHARSLVVPHPTRAVDLHLFAAPPGGEAWAFAAAAEARAAGSGAREEERA